MGASYHLTATSTIPAMEKAMADMDQRVAELEARVRRLKKPKRSGHGGSAISYGMIAALIAVAAIAAMQGLGNQLNQTFKNVPER